MLVLPSVKKGGVVVGGAYGEGALLIDDKPVAYYSTTSGSIGLQAGYQDSVVYMFMTDEALRKFRESSGWQVGTDASVTVIDSAASSKVESRTFDQPVLAFVFGESGLMAGVSLEGSKISPLKE
jgi:lipid-binding SYLF domain-containing protein